MRLILMCCLILFTKASLAFAAVEETLSNTAEYQLSKPLLALLAQQDTSTNAFKQSLSQQMAERPQMNPAEQFVLLVLRAKLAKSEQDYQQALTLLDEAEPYLQDLVEHQRNHPYFAQNCLLKSEIFAIQGDFEKAYNARWDYMDKQTAHRNYLKQKEVDALEAVYLTKKKQQENQLMEKEAQVMKLRIAEQEKDAMATNRNLVLLFCLAVVFFILLIRQLRLRKNLKRIAQRDNLTGLTNRRKLFKDGTELFEHHNATNSKLGVILLDIDNFKQINDTYGHDKGDVVLKVMAQIGAETMRARDILARLGGEEFVAILPNASLSEAKAIAERFREKINQYDYSLIELPQPVTASFGVANISQVNSSFDDLLNAADLAMYQAKNNGKNQVIAHQD